MEPYVRNLWYVAAWEDEVPEGGMLPRTLLDEPRLLYRLADGSYAALADRCPHRFAPLSRGKRAGDRIVCGYHGLEFGADGGCVRNPFSDLIPPNTQVSSWPTEARWGAVWVWPGDAAAADPALIPDFSFIDAGPPIVRGRTHMRANFEFITDNLMDLSHAEFLHIETFATNGALFNGEHSATQDDSGAIWSNWRMPDTPPPPFATALVPDGGRVDQWLEMRWHAPASMALFIGVAHAGSERQAMVVPAMANPHIITPETATSSHYFFTREPGEASEAMAKQVFDAEDGPMLEAIQHAMLGRDFWAERPVVLSVDAAAIRARRRLMQLRRSEAPAPIEVAA